MMLMNPEFMQKADYNLKSIEVKQYNGGVKGSRAHFGVAIRQHGIFARVVT